MTLQAAKTEHARLCRIIKQADKDHFGENSDKITDMDYDTAMRELAVLEKMHPELVKPTSPTQVVGGFAPEEGQVSHNPPMLSLDKIHARDGTAKLAKFIEGKGDLFASMKMDGLAASIIYDHGRLDRVATRGDGRTGEDITDNADLIRNLPKKIKHTGRIELRGELIIKRARMNELNAKRRNLAEEEFSNLRNAVAGMMRQKHRTLSVKAVDFIAYDMIGLSTSNLEETFEVLKKLGFETPWIAKSVYTLEQAVALLNAVEKGRLTNTYDTDGVVLRVKDNVDYLSCGFTARAPKGAVAWKFEDMGVQTTIEDVEYQIGRSGVITPVAVLRPVKVSGAVVRKATLHNIAFMRQLGVLKGDNVTLIRSGDVIPKITGVNAEMRSGLEPEFEIPQRCPSCSTKLLADGVDLKCINHDCLDTRIAIFEHFVSRPVMNIKGISTKTIEKILRSGKVNHPADMFALTLSDFIEMNDSEGTTNPDGEHADATAKMKALNAARKTTLARALVSLCIKGLGQSAAEALAAQAAEQEHPDEEYYYFSTASVEELMKAEGVGQETAQSIYNFFHNKEHSYIPRDHLLQLRRNGVVWSRPDSPSLHQVKDGSLSGKLVLITGSVKGMTREEAKQKLIVEKGGKVASAVSGKLDLVIIGDKPGGKKIEKIQELGLPMLSVDEFLEEHGG